MRGIQLSSSQRRSYRIAILIFLAPGRVFFSDMAPRAVFHSDTRVNGAVFHSDTRAHGAVFHSDTKSPGTVFHPDSRVPCVFSLL